MQVRPLLVLAALAAAAEPDLGRGALARVEGALRAKHARDPMGAAVATVLLASVLFHRAERGHNPKVSTLYDALLHVTSSLTGGANGSSPTTTAGKAITAATATFGPAMARRILDEPSAVANAELRDRAVLERLDAIVTALEERA